MIESIGYLFGKSKSLNQTIRFTYQKVIEVNLGLNRLGTL